MTSLDAKAWFGLVFLVLCIGTAIFLPAGTFYYWQAWIFILVFTLPTAAITIYLMKHDPALLQRRVQAGPTAETEPVQRIIQSLAAAAFVAIFVVSALDHRWGWSAVPVRVVVLGDMLVAGGLALVFLVFRENSYTSATIEVGVAQTTISTGPYAIVRHPMYAGAFVMLAGVPVALGSWWGLVSVIPLGVVILWRLKEEEAFLATALTGYKEYKNKVRYRLVPFLW